VYYPHIAITLKLKDLHKKEEDDELNITEI